MSSDNIREKTRAQRYAFLGQVVARLGARLGPILADLERALGRSWPILAVLGPILADLGRSWPVLARLGARLGPSWGLLGASLGHPRAKNSYEFPTFYATFARLRRC